MDNAITSKTCTKCNQSLPATKDFFQLKVASDPESGFRAACKECLALYRKKYYSKNVDKFKEWSKRNYIEKREDYRRREKLWREKNPNHSIESYYKHREKRLARHREYYEENKEKVSARHKKYRDSHREETANHQRRRRARVRGVKNDNHTLEDILKTYGNTCYLCNNLIDMSAPRSMRHPNWELGLHIDHVVPIFHGGNNTIDNVRPTHAICNLKKGSKLE